MIAEQDFIDVFDTNHIELINFAYYRTGDMDKAKDLVQEAFVLLWKKRTEFESNSVKSLLYRMISNQVVDGYRKEQVRVKFANTQPTAEYSNSVEFEFEELEFKERLERAISALPARQREVFLMNRMEGHKYREIADLLKLSQKAVEKRMALALHTLRNSLQYNI